MHQKLIAFNQSQRRTFDIPELRSGDVIKVYRKIREGNKERTQMFQGTIIAIKGGQSSSPTITVRKDSFGIGVELILPLSSPQIEKIEFVKRTKSRRSKLYFVRDKSVKVLRKKLKEMRLKESQMPVAAEEAPEAPLEEEAAPSPEEEQVEAPVEEAAAPEETASESEETAKA